jgi:predicted nucleic acid-binding protein
MLAVYDCMCFVRSAGRPDRNRPLFDFVHSGQVTLCLSPQVLAEIRDVLTRPTLIARFSALTREAVDAFLAQHLRLAKWINDVPEHYILSRDPKDSKYLNLAITAGANSKQYVLVNHFGSQQVAAYQLDANGVPIFNTQKTFISGIPGVIGAAIDPLTGDFLFSTTGAYGAGDHIFVVSPTGATSGVSGDYNQNGIVDAADYTVWRDHMGQTASSYTLPNEGDSVGIVNQADFAFWKLHFGDHAGSGSGASANTAIPEPTTLGMLLLGFLTMSRRRNLRPSGRWRCARSEQRCLSTSAQ